jgi:DNA invertase Pin-like site-specific DNA recombinase
MTIHFLLRRSKAEGQDHSIDVQRTGCAAFVAAKGLKGKVVEHVSDSVAGADIEGLHVVRETIDQVKPGDVVVCRNHSRLGREHA